MNAAEIATLHLRPAGTPMPFPLTQDQIEARHNFELARKQALSQGIGSQPRMHLYSDDADTISAMLLEHEEAMNLLARIVSVGFLPYSFKEEAISILNHTP